MEDGAIHSFMKHQGGAGWREDYKACFWDAEYEVLLIMIQLGFRSEVRADDAVGMSDIA